MVASGFDFDLLSTAGICVCLIYFIAGIVDAVCGGGGLLTVPALMTIGLPPHMVVGTNQCSVILGGITALYKYMREGKCDLQVCLHAIPFTLVGAYIGVRLNLLVSERYLQVIMMVLLPVMTVFTFTSKSFGQEDHSDELPKTRKFIIAALITLVISAYQAFYGPASGLFFIALLCAVMKYDVLTANGNTKFLLLAASMISSTEYAISGNVQWQIVPFAAAAYIAGNYLGASLALSRGSRVVKPMFCIMLIGLFIKLVTDYFTG